MLLEKLTNTHGVSGHEEAIRNLIIEEIKEYVDSYEIDRMGNIIAYKNHDGEGKHIGLSAHMDEVGLIVKGIGEDGLIHFISGGIDPRVLVAKRVLVGDNLLPGVIGSKPIHHLTVEEREKALTVEQLYVDIGSKSKEETAKLVNLGDFITFDSQYKEFGEHQVKAKALDDRVGCSVMIEMLKKEWPYKITAMFLTQEESGMRGSLTASYYFEGDIILNLEGTISADMPDVKEHQKVTVLGEGPAISLLDRTSIYLKPYVNSVVRVAEEHNIPYQYRKTGSGGTDAMSYHRRREGKPVIGISVPCRYIHSPVSVMDKRDYKNMILLVEKYIESFNKEDIIHE